MDNNTFVTDNNFVFDGMSVFETEEAIGSYCENNIDLAGLVVHFYIMFLLKEHFLDLT
jgi:hypothetical protein